MPAVLRRRTLLATSVLFLLLLLAASPAAAQRRHVEVGLKFGAGVAHFRGHDARNRQARLLVGAGAFLNYPLSRHVALQPELMVSNKGGDLDGEDVDGGQAGDFRSRYTLGYVEIPVLLKVMPRVQGRVRPNVFAGPALAVKVFGDVGAESMEERLRRLDWGIAVGAGVDFKAAGSRVMLDARYTFGLTNILELAGPPQVRNGAFLVSAGINL